jgi:hypothetical protein
MSEFKVRALDSAGQPSIQEKEQQNQAQLEAQQQQQQTPPAPEPPAKPSIEEGDVLSFIKERYKKEISSIDDLLVEPQKQEPLPEDVATFLKYKKETGRGIDDFIKLNKDLDSVDPDQLLVDYALAQEEYLDKEDALSILAEKFGYDEDLEDESSVKKKKASKKRELAKAKKYFSDLKEQYKVPLESRGSLPEESPEYKQYKEYLDRANSEQQEAKRKGEWFQKKTEELFSPEFKGFEFGIGEKKYTFMPGEASEIKSQNSTPVNLISKFIDEQGLIKDAAGYHKALSIAMNPDKFAKFFYEQGVASATEDMAKRSKNINMDIRTSGQPVTTTGGVKVADVSPTSSGMGLKIRPFKTS